jgi:hypothetical protein
MYKFEEIIKAWITKWNPNERERELSKRRLAICATCPSRKETLGDLRLFVICDECGCPLEAKSHSPVKGACPLGKWNDIENQMIKD